MRYYFRLFDSFLTTEGVTNGKKPSDSAELVQG